jgi:hypothetical protein
MYPIIVLLGKKISDSELAGQFTLVKGTPMTSMLINLIKNLRLTNGKCAVSVVCHFHEVMQFQQWIPGNSDISAE